MFLQNEYATSTLRVHYEHAWVPAFLAPSRYSSCTAVLKRSKQLYILFILHGFLSGRSLSRGGFALQHSDCLVYTHCASSMTQFCALRLSRCTRATASARGCTRTRTEYTVVSFLASFGFLLWRRQLHVRGACAFHDRYAWVESAPTAKGNNAGSPCALTPPSALVEAFGIQLISMRAQPLPLHHHWLANDYIPEQWAAGYLVHGIHICTGLVAVIDVAVVLAAVDAGEGMSQVGGSVPPSLHTSCKHKGLNVFRCFVVGTPTVLASPLVGALAATTINYCRHCWCCFGFFYRFLHHSI